MHHPHGVMAQGGHSLDGVLYGQGEPISILEDELTTGSHDVMRVLSLSTRQPMAVLSSSVCWLPADGSAPLPWAAMSPAGDVPELDVFPENNLASGLSSPSVASPLTPTASISPLDSLRRDSAVSFGRNDEFDDAMGSNFQALQPANMTSFGPASASVPSHVYEPVDHATMADKLDLAPPHGVPSFFENDYAPWNSYPQDMKASALMDPSASNFQVNYMRMHTPYEYSAEAPPHERRAAPAQAAQTWTQPAAMPNYDWQSQVAHPYSDTVPASQSSQADVPRFHDAVAFPPDPRQQHFQMMNSLQSYDMSRAQGGQSQAPSPQGAVLHQPTFYRAPEQHTMELTDVNYHGIHTRPISTPRSSKSHSSRNGRRSEPEPKPTPEEQALRPHLVLEYFQREVKPDIDALEARQREQGDYPTDEARARLVSEALDLVRPAVKNVTQALEALPPQNSQPWGGTQKRLQSDAEHILSMIQIIRRSALEETELRQHDPRTDTADAKPRKGLSALVKDYVDKAEYVGKVTGHGARKEKTEAASHRAAANPVANGRPQAMAYPSAGMGPVDWTQGQTTTPPPDQRSGAIGHYHQQQQQAYMQHNLPASPAAYAAMSTYDPRPSSSRPIAEAAMATVMAPSGGPVGPAAAWMAHHPSANANAAPPRVSAAGLGGLGYAMPPSASANMYPSPPGYGASSAPPQQHQVQVHHHHPYAGVAAAAPSPFPGHLQMGMQPGGGDVAAGRRGSLPDRRLMARERAAPYSLAYRMPSERKGSV